MHNHYTLLSTLLATALLLGTTAMRAEDRSVKLVTSKAVGSEITLLVNHTHKGVTVDWGDGNPQTYTSERNAIAEITGTIKGNTIIVSGDAQWNTLSCADCGITSIDLTNAKALKSLYCQNNALETLNLRGMTALTDLDVSNNSLKSITYTSSTYPEKDLVNIENINLSNNQLSGRFVMRSEKLQSVDISNNKYTTLITAAANTELAYLNCAHNSIASISATYCPKLSTVICNDNVLKTLKFASNGTALVQLYCDDNKLSTALDLSAQTGLTDLSVANNELSSILLPDAKLSTLSVAGNKLTLALLPKKANRPSYISFVPQDTISLYNYENVLHKDGVAYMPINVWDTRTQKTLDLSPLRYINRTESTTGVLEANYTWFVEDAEGNATQLTKGTGSSATNDYYEGSGKFSFFTAQPKVFARITAYRVYADDNIYLETSRIAIGEESVTGIGRIATATSDLQILTTHGSMTLTASAPTTVRIYSSDGRSVWSDTVSGSVTISLPSGIYIVNGQKVAL